MGNKPQSDRLDKPSLYNAGNVMALSDKFATAFRITVWIMRIGIRKNQVFVEGLKIGDGELLQYISILNAHR
jgi:hypothetical protein